MKTMIRDLLHVFLFIASMSVMSCNKTAQPSPDSDDVYDWNKDSAFGWATCASLNSVEKYGMTGGEGGKEITLTSTGQDMREDISNAINNYDKIIFDGSNGPFYLSSVIDLVGVKNKTLLGINDARLKTAFSMTPEIHKMLEDKGVKDISSHDKGGTLPNGKKVAEAREYYTRLYLIEYLDDLQESYRSAGLLSLEQCENIIIRNLAFEGPGAIDVGGKDPLNFSKSTHHVWIDHCSFTDGMDGNFDINSKSDMITVSWCKFAYTDKSFDHRASNLIGSNEDPSSEGEDNLNVTFAYCIWGAGCDVRMPVVRFGKVHVFNCWYDCAGNNSPALEIRIGSEVLIENNYFDTGVKNICRTTSDAKAWQFKGNIFREGYKPDDTDILFMPYEYHLITAEEVPSILGGENGAGPTLD